MNLENDPINEVERLKGNVQNELLSSVKFAEQIDLYIKDICFEKPRKVSDCLKELISINNKIGISILMFENLYFPLKKGDRSRKNELEEKAREIEGLGKERVRCVEELETALKEFKESMKEFIENTPQYHPPTE